jgi:adapter protein MecA 1/2
MIDEANIELGFEVNGNIAVEVYSLPAQGMVIIVTKDSIDNFETDDEFSDDYIEMQVTLDESDAIFYEYQSFEDIIQLAIRLHHLKVKSGKLYSFQNKFFLLFDEDENDDNFIAILSEYGNPSTTTTHLVHEYGKLLMQENAIERIFGYFGK